PTLAALLAFYGFFSLFPALLVVTTIAGFIGNDAIGDSVIGAVLGGLPVFGERIGRDATQPLQGSAFALVAGLIGVLYGAMGVAQAGQHAMAEIWNVPGVVRPGFPVRLVRSLAFLALLGAGITVLATLGNIGTLGDTTLLARLASLVLQVGLTVGLYVACFRVLTPKSIDTRELLPGAIVGGVGYSALLIAGSALVRTQLRHAEALYGQFALVLGLLGWLQLVATVSLYGAEVNVVLRRKLWPRSIVQPPLTEADERVLRDIARQGERRPEQRVEVDFDEREPEAG
ncbi:MAG: YihY/virulence factor BrkB family protein, partial [Actinomycetota bacterium]|nr:YihY/virulence factor BrkB family protein [Actinomycetota bacterium]